MRMRITIMTDNATTAATTAAAVDIQPMRRTLEIGTVDRHPAFVEVEIAARQHGPRLSISGTTAHGGGQCIDTIAAIPAADLAPGWTVDLRDRLVAIWRRYHLNDTQAGCIHQRHGYEVRTHHCTAGHAWTSPRRIVELTSAISGELRETCPACGQSETGADPAVRVPGWDTSARIETISYSIVWEENRRIERACASEKGISIPGKVVDDTRTLSQADACRYRGLIDRLKIVPFTWTPIPDAATAASLAEIFTVCGEHETPPIPKRPRLSYAVYKYRPVILRRVFTSYAGHVRPSEHPAGVLGKPCSVCGYKYGSVWLYEPIPASVATELQAMPSGRDTEQPDEDPTASPYDIQTARLLKRHAIRFEPEHVKAKPPNRGGRDTSPAQHWRVTLHGPAGTGAPLSFDFWASINDTAKGIALSAYTVLACLSSDMDYTDPDETIAEIGGSMKQARAAATFAHRINRWIDRQPDPTALRTDLEMIR